MANNYGRGPSNLPIKNLRYLIIVSSICADSVNYKDGLCDADPRGSQFELNIL